MSKITITRAVQLPDPIRLARYSKAPELGPRILFFSGGTALRELSRKLLRYTHNSIHLITPFDSGGSSAHLRKHFHMLAVGDLRNRLMALADRSLTGNPEILELFGYRFPKDAEPADLRERLTNMLRGRDDLVSDIPDPMRKLIRSHLAFFVERMPDNFELRGASIGNLILAGGFFNYKRHIDPVVYLFTKLVEAKGVVRPVISVDLHLVSELMDGTVLVGQHLITGKEAPPLKKPIKNVYLSASRESPRPVRIRIRNKVEELIKSAELICYPMGSFYSSIVANLLPEGVGQAISEADCPKVFIPNTTADPEQVGMNLHQSVGRLLEYLERSCTSDSARDRLLNFVLIDSKRGGYTKPFELNKIKRFGIEVLDLDLITEQSAPYLDDDRVLEQLLSLV